MHFPPPVGPTCGQWTCTSVKIKPSEEIKVIYLGPDLGQQYMYPTTNDVIAPRLVRPSERLRRKRLNAVRDAVVHGIVPGAGLRLRRADALDGTVHSCERVYVESVRLETEKVEIWDPSIVVENRAFVVETPERDLTKISDMDTNLRGLCIPALR